MDKIRIHNVFYMFEFIFYILKPRYLFSNENKPGLFEEVVDSRAGGRKIQMTLEDCIVSENKDVLKKG